MSEATDSAAEAPDYDYTKLEGPALVAALGDDPSAWSTAAHQHAGIVGGHITHGFLKDWFTMALRGGRRPPSEQQAGFARAVVELKERENKCTAWEGELASEREKLEAAKAAFQQEVAAFEQFKKDKTAATEGKGQPAPVITGKGGSTDAPGNPDE